MSGFESISDAALWAVTCRAHESRRADRVLDDPFASHLSTDRCDSLFFGIADHGVACFAQAVGVATIDEVLLHAISNQHVHTVVNIGAGLDARPYRLQLPSDLRWIEAESAPVLDYKVLRLAHAEPYCQLQRVNVDLGDAAERRVLLANLAANVRWGLVLTEALTALTPGALEDLVTGMPATFRYWIADTIGNPSSLGSIRLNGSSAAVKPEHVLAIFERHGWRSTQFRPLKNQALLLCEARATRLVESFRSPGELEGIWLFQHAG